MAEATIRDVARRAEVSVASVSRALNGLNNVRAETRERVIAAAKELGYVPHAGARSLSLARAHAIGVVLPDLHGEFFSECVRGMDREASRRGYVLLLSNMHDDSEQAANALRTMRGRVDGLLVMAPHIPPAALERALPQSAARGADQRPGRSSGRAVAALRQFRRRRRDRPPSGRQAAIQHIVHIAGPEGQCRRAGARRRLSAGDGEPRARHRAAHHRGDFNEETGAAAARDDPRQREPLRRRVRRQRHDGARLPPRAAPAGKAGARATSPWPASTTCRSPATWRSPPSASASPRSARAPSPA
jgi:LacI family transcriptional regulator